MTLFQIKKLLTITKNEKVVQEFQQICSNSCSRSEELRNFTLSRESYNFSFFNKFNFNAFQSLRIKCKNCGWTRTIPENFARKIFKKGLKSNDLLNISKDRVISSRILNFYGGFWRVWLLCLGVLMLITFVRFISIPVQIGTPQVVSFKDAITSPYQGKIVTLSGKVDYTNALTESIIQQGKVQKTVKSEVFMPLYADSNNVEYIVIRVNKIELEKLRKIAVETDLSKLRNQDYTITGRIEPLENLKNEELRKFFVEELPTLKNNKGPRAIINAAEIQPISAFFNEFKSYYLWLILLLMSSTIIQLYIDRKIIKV